MKLFFIIVAVLVVSLIILNQFITRTIKSEIIIDASVEKVWDIFMDHAEYPNWNPFVRQISGPADVGSILSVTIGAEGKKPMDFTPLVLVNETNIEFRWIGKLGVKGIFDGEHYFLLEEVGPNQTKFTQGENFTGLLAGMFMLILRKDTEIGFNAMNDALKYRVEAN